MSNVESAILPTREMQTDLVHFLTCSKIVCNSGYIYSWINPNHPGFVYPEAMGLYLTLVSQLSLQRNYRYLAEQAHAVANSLQHLISPLGGIGKNEKLYLFDTCMAVNGLLTYKKYLNGYVNPTVVADMSRFIMKMAQQRLAVVADNGSLLEIQPHWSSVFGASMLKTVIALDALAVETGEHYFSNLALEIAEEVVRECYSDGVFHVFPETTLVYCHAHCYALEGLLYLHSRDYLEATELLSGGAQSLQRWQNSDGSLFNWYNAPSRELCKVCDATAQALRIWIAVDRDRFAEAINKGFTFLLSLRSPDFGLYYCDRSLDVNSWASIFATQAMDWSLNGVQSDCIV
ncbi:hypothetical protein [Chroogloeocystis siderophila]|jgi:hypothetical protein|uniref:Uncharacterized protein n=1 Tax=Chroogloeocystis siderophila 5.2 s.c.1 TaxID=247279 RepID=A0A1U7HMD1_9CHRO|nr:hypothetical protein [Chroogloeocystis siderophila]OKH24711.1 hypothetical protein NIES1031_15560 [Chroogloeocystis siderophila 5.2 s.c.1]